MAQISIPLIQGANSTNNVSDAFDSRTAQFNQERVQQEKQQDADFHTVVKYASDGLTNEAKYFAQQKGIQVPDEVFKNADFAKGLSIAGDLYDDPVAAQKFTTAYVSTGGDLMSRYNAGLGAAGKPMSKDERDLALYGKKLAMQQQYSSGSADNKGFSLSAGETRYDANGNVVASAPKGSDDFDIWNKTYNASISSGLKSEEEARIAADAAVAQKQLMSGGTTNNPTAHPANPNGNPAINMPVDKIQPVIMDGRGNMSATQQGQGRLTPPPAPQVKQQTQLPAGLQQGSKLVGKTPEGYDLYQAPDGRQFYDDGKPEIQSGNVQMNNAVTNNLSSPAMVEYNPQAQIPRSPVDRPVITQQNGMNILMPQSQASSGGNRWGTTYQSINPNDSRGNAAIKYADNLVNVPSHLRVAGGVVGQGLSGAASVVSKGLTSYLGNIDEMVGDVGNYLSSPVAGNLIKMVGTNGDTVYVYERDLPYAQSIGYQQS